MPQRRRDTEETRNFKWKLEILKCKLAACIYDGAQKRHSHMNGIQRIQCWLRRRRYREGKILLRFIARDIRREILIVSAARIDEGIITGRVRTGNVLYISKGLVSQPEFEPVRELHVKEMWKWPGQGWGGLPDGTSIADRSKQKGSDSSQE